MRRAIYITIALLSSPFILYYGTIGLRFAGIIQGTKSAPKYLNLDRMVVYGPGCSGFWCSGGKVYKLNPRSTKNIDEVLTRNGWQKCPSYTRDSKASERCEFTPRFGAPKYGNTSIMYQAMRAETYYISGSSQNPMIVTPKSRLVYLGWFD